MSYNSNFWGQFFGPFFGPLLGTFWGHFRDRFGTRSGREGDKIGARGPLWCGRAVGNVLRTSMTCSWHTVFIEVSYSVEMQQEKFMDHGRVKARSGFHFSCSCMSCYMKVFLTPARKASWYEHDMYLAHGFDRGQLRCGRAVGNVLPTRMTCSWHTVFIEVSCRVEMHQEKFMGEE